VQNLAVTPCLANIRLHPIKSLDPVPVSEARIGPNGGLELDRAWALYAADGRWVNAKRTAAMHLIRSVYAPDLRSVTLSVPGDRRNVPAMTFAFPGDTEGAAEWFSMYFEQRVVVHYAREGFPDDGLASGPTIISTGSLEAVCRWFPGMTLEESRRRFRTTLEIDAVPGSPGHGVGPIHLPQRSDWRERTVEESGAASSAASGVATTLLTQSHDSSAEEIESRNPNGAGTSLLPAFWEDRLFSDSATTVVRFRIGEVAFEGSNPCARCPVPARDSFTGKDHMGFQKRFVQERRANLPAWSSVERFDHYYRLATNTRVPSTEEGKVLRIGDPVQLQA
jgi:uncharacterized protein YcbX